MGYIYKIDCGDEFYIGSTKNMNQRLIEHRRDAKRKPYKLYNKIRENNIIIKMDILKEYPDVDDKRELGKLEQEFIDNLKPTLNSYKAYRTDEQKKECNKLQMRKTRANGGEELRLKELESRRKYTENNKEKLKAKRQEIVVCECGISVTRGCLTRHRQRAPHLDLMRSNLI